MGMRLAFILTLAASLACSGTGTASRDEASTAASSPQAAAPPGAGEAAAAAGGAAPAPEILNARHPSPGLLTGGQLTQEQMAALHAQGYARFINLRPADEAGTGWEEAYASEHGIEFVRIPVAGAEEVSLDNAQRLAAELEEADGTPTVVYCGSGNRVGALLALKAHQVDGLTAEEALALGRDAGLTRLEPKVREILGLPPAGS